MPTIFVRLIPSCLAACLLTACAGPQSDLPRAAQALHDSAIVIDAHADIEIPGKPSMYVGNDGLSKVAPDKMEAGGVDVVVMTVAAGPGPRTPQGYAAAKRVADEKLAAVLEMVRDPENRLVLARTAEDVVTAHRQGNRAFILGFQNALILGEDVSGLDQYFAAGVRVFALTHLGHNDYADSSRPAFISSRGTHEPEAEHGGLSPLGVAAIKRINKLGGVIDISQLSKQAAMQVLALSETPVIASHSNVRRLSEVSRNLSDEEIDLVGQKGGVIHLSPFRGYLFDSSDQSLESHIRLARRAAGIKEDYYYPFELYWEIEDADAKHTFLNSISTLLGPGSVNAMLNHLDYVVQRIGIDHVGIGTDFNHGSGIEGFNDASEAFNITLALLERGYSGEDIEKIWGGNFLRVLRRAQQH